MPVATSRASKKEISSTAVDDRLLDASIDYIRKYGGTEFCMLVVNIKSKSPPKGMLYAEDIANNPQFLEIAKGSVSLDYPVADDEDITFRDVLVSEAPTPDKVAEQSFAARWINQLVENAPLSPQEREFLCKGFGLDGCDEVSFIELGKQHGISREAAYQTAVRAVRKLARILKRAEITADCF